MKILLINPPVEEPDKRCFPPLGLLYIASFIRKRHDVSLIDANSRENLITSHTIETSALKGFDVIGISTVISNFRNAVKIAKRIKSLSPHTKVVLGGHHATATHEYILANFPEVDIVVRGEGEVTFLHLLNNLEKGESLKNILGISYRDGNSIRINPSRPLIKNLDVLPFPARDLIKLDHYSVSFQEPFTKRVRSAATIVSSRGCPYQCSFCAVPSFYAKSDGAAWRPRSPNNVADEIFELVIRYGIEHFYFVDDNCLLDPFRVVDIVEKLKKRDVDITFTFAARSDNITKNTKTIQFLQKFGLRSIELGAESGSDSILLRLNKQLSVQDNVKAIDFLKESKINVAIDFIMFEPDMRIDELKENLAFLWQTGFSGNYPLLFHRLHLLPGTDCLHDMERQNRVLGNIAENPYYRFKNEDVAYIWSLMSAFRDQYIPLINEVVIKLKTVRDRIDFQPRPVKKHSNLKSIVSQLLIEELHLRRIPYFFMNELVRVLSEPHANRNRIDKLKDNVQRMVSGVSDEIDKHITLLEAYL